MNLHRSKDARNFINMLRKLRIGNRRQTQAEAGGEVEAKTEVLPSRTLA